MTAMAAIEARRLGTWAPRMLIGGQLVEGSADLEIVDPATGEVFATCGRADRAQAAQAIAAASEAFPAWAARSVEARGECLALLADAIEARADELARLLTQEQGKPAPQAAAEVAGAIGTMRYYAAERLPLIVVRETGTDLIAEQRVPLGVVAAITPWNYPVSLLAGKVAPALLAGNTLVAKPAATTPLTSLLFGEIAAAILPPGVLNIIVDANDLGDLLTSDPAVAKVSFTGSTATGRKVMASGSHTLKRLTLELGGNDAAIVLDDADVDAIAPRLFRAAMINAGQVCMAAKRIYAPRALYDPLCEALAALAKAAVVGPGNRPETEIGPLQNRAQYERVLDLLGSASREGRVIAGGEALPGGGYFIAPTVVRDLAPDARIVAEEQFGPVIPVVAYDDEEEVIRLANASEFGLAASIWTGDHRRGLALAQRITCGTVWVNKHLDLPLDVSFGGAKQSGIGRERGRAGLEEFTQLKLLNIAKQ